MNFSGEGNYEDTITMTHKQDKDGECWFSRD